MIELKDLVGLHTLTGVDRNDQSIEKYASYYEDCEVINFVLDGITYSAIEDPEDGYRSSLDEVLVSDVSVSNMFPPVKVMGVMKAGNCEILDFHDTVNGKVVLEIGTDRYDDWYPVWVGNFNPQNMHVNEG